MLSSLICADEGGIIDRCSATELSCVAYDEDEYKKGSKTGLLYALADASFSIVFVLISAPVLPKKSSVQQQFAIQAAWLFNHFPIKLSARIARCKRTIGNHLKFCTV